MALKLRQIPNQSPLPHAASTRSNLHYQQALSDIQQSHEAREALLAQTKQMHQQAYSAAALRLQTELNEQVQDWYVGPS